MLFSEVRNVASQEVNIMAQKAAVLGSRPEEPPVEQLREDPPRLEEPPVVHKLNLSDNSVDLSRKESIAGSPRRGQDFVHKEELVEGSPRRGQHVLAEDQFEVVMNVHHEDEDKDEHVVEFSDHVFVPDDVELKD